MGTQFGQNPKSHDFHDFRGSPARFKPDFSLSAAPARNVQILSGKPLPRKVFLNIAWGVIYNYCAPSVHGKSFFVLVFSFFRFVFFVALLTSCFVSSFRSAFLRLFVY